MSDGVFRQKPGFTAVQNNVVKDKTLSLKGKGLYLVIQGYITIPDTKWKKSFFQNMCQEGDKAFNNAWDELKAKGYLHVHNYSVGGVFRVEYELLDEAVEGPHTFYYNKFGEVTSTNESRTPQNGSNGNGSNGNGRNGNSNSEGSSAVKGRSNNNIDSKNEIKKDKSIYQSTPEDRWNEIVEHKKVEGALPIERILQDASYQDAFIGGLMKNHGNYFDETKQAALETIPMILGEMLNLHVPTTVKGMKITAPKILAVIEKRLNVDEKNMDLNEVIDMAINDYVRAVKKGSEEIKNSTGFLKSCLWYALVRGNLSVQSAITRYETMVNQEGTWEK